MTDWITTHLFAHIASGHLGRQLDDRDEEASGAMVSDHVVLDGLCAAEGASYWSWDGTIELRPHGHIRMIGIRSEHASDGEATAAYPYNREHWIGTGR